VNPPIRLESVTTTSPSVRSQAADDVVVGDGVGSRPSCQGLRLHGSAEGLAATGSVLQAA